jgi:hypothetical protein
LGVTFLADSHCERDILKLESKKQIIKSNFRLKI